MSKELFHLVAPAEPIVYAGGDLKILLIDAGAKDNIARSLLARGATVKRVPWFDDLAKHASDGRRNRHRQWTGEPEGPGRS